MIGALGLIAATGLLSWLGVRFVIDRAHRLGLVDEPNHRSSHEAPTPSGGGLGIAVAGALAGLTSPTLDR